MAETFNFDKNNPEETQRFVESLVRSTIKQDKAIEEGRRGLFGNGLMKSLALKEKGSEQRLANVLEFLQACQDGNEYQLGKLSERNLAEYKTMLNDGRITPMEFKTLAPALEGTNSSGGYAVPIEWAADLNRNLGKYGYARRYLRNYNMARNKTNIPGLLTKPTVAVTAEDAAITASKPIMDNLQLVAKKIAAIYTATNEYLEDTNLDNYAIILDIFTEQFQIAEDKGAFQNANTNWNGMLWYGAGAITSGIAANGAIAVSRTGSATGGATTYPQIGDTAGATDSWGDLLLTIQAQPSALFEGGKIFMPQEVLIAMLGIRDTQKHALANVNNIWNIHTGLEGQATLYLYGYECVPLPNGIMLTYDASAHVSAPFLAMCNPMRCWAMMGIRGGFFVDTLREATVDSISIGEYDLTGIRMKERVAFGIGRPETMAVLRCDAS